MKKIILMGVPHHNNLGDSAIAIAERKFLKDNYKNCEFFEISEETLEKCIYKVKKHINNEDIIYLHGGGNLGDEYLYIEEARRKVIELFSNNTIIFFPQTMYFSNTTKGKEELEKTKKIYSNHKHLTIVARENISYENMKNEFTNNIVIKTPDIVTYLNKTKDVGEREGLLFVLRNDIEANLNKKQIKEMEEISKRYFDKIEYTDTAIGDSIFEHYRESKLEKLLEKYRKAKLVITDRLHGMIFGAITSTPCIALDNYNHKVKGCSEYLNQFNFIKYISNINEMEEQIKYLLNTKLEEYNNEFAVKEFEKLLKVGEE